MNVTPIALSAPENLEYALSIPDDVYAPDFGDQPDPERWFDPDSAATFGATQAPTEEESDLEHARRLRVVPMPAKRSLANHVNAVEFIAETIEQMDDAEMTDQVRDELSRELIAELAGTRAKVDNVCRTLAMFENLEAAAKAERERLQKREAYYSRQAERLTTYVLAVFDASKLDRLDGELSTLQRRKNPAKVVIEDLAAVPREYLRFKAPPPPEADRVAIARDLKKERAVPGCRLEVTARLVRS